MRQCVKFVQRARIRARGTIAILVERGQASIGQLADLSFALGGGFQSGVATLPRTIMELRDGSVRSCLAVRDRNSSPYPRQGSIGFFSFQRDGWLIFTGAIGVEFSTTKSPQGMDRGGFNGKKQVRLEPAGPHGAFAQHSDGKRFERPCELADCTIFRHKGLAHVTFDSFRPMKAFSAMLRIFF
jgi:hypothetical protein